MGQINPRSKTQQGLPLNKEKSFFILWNLQTYLFMMYVQKMDRHIYGASG